MAGGGGGGGSGGGGLACTTYHRAFCVNQSLGIYRPGTRLVRNLYGYVMRLYTLLFFLFLTSCPLTKQCCCCLSVYVCLSIPPHPPPPSLSLSPPSVSSLTHPKAQSCLTGDETEDTRVTLNTSNSSVDGASNFENKFFPECTSKLTPHKQSLSVCLSVCLSSVCLSLSVRLSVCLSLFP